MNEHMKAILESKRRERGRLAALPFSEKIAILEKLRDRTLEIANSPLARKRASYSDKVQALRQKDNAR